ncbi:MAG: hypothetical protein PHX55_04565 [Eubacteriales bacterium]|nr:hypothetical protein [Eubacteriales bacterium]MDD3866869.1 hypothetical protein [Eubacteriales bacterium]
MQLRIRPASGTLKRRLLWLVLVLVLLLAVMAVIWRFWPKRTDIPDIQFGLPDFPTDQSDLYDTYGDMTAALRDRAELRLADGLVWYEWYQQAGPLRQPPAQRSDSALLSDQLLYGQLLLEQKDRRDFTDWWEAFSTQWLESGGSRFPLSGDNRWLPAEQQQVLQLLGQSMTLWPDAGRLDALQALSDQLLADYDGKLPSGLPVAVPSPLPAPDPAATPTPRPTATPTPDPTVPILTVVRLADLDLLALTDLIQIDEKWQPLRDEALRVIQDGYAGDELPLFALAWSADDRQYVLFSGDQPYLELEPSLRAMIHLAEIGQLPERCLSWLKDQLYNRGALYMAYHSVQGDPAVEGERPLIYALAARLALTADDPVLYNLAVDRLLSYRATSQTSDVRSAIFRIEPDALVRVWSVDNLMALLVLR